MENILQEITNMPETLTPKPAVRGGQAQTPKAPLSDLLGFSHGAIDFGYCLPGSIHERVFTIVLKKQLEFGANLDICIVSADQNLYDAASLVYGVKKVGQTEYYDEYKLKIKQAKTYEFKIGVQTPMFYEYSVQSTMYIHFMDYPPTQIPLSQRAQVPQLLTTRQLYLQDTRMIKLSYLHGRGKKECRVPFKLNHQMTLAVVAEIVGIGDGPCIDVKPRCMTLSGKGQFSLSITMNLDSHTIECLSKGVSKTVRKILTLTIKDSQFIYHFPLEVTYFPERTQITME